MSDGAEKTAADLFGGGAEPRNTRERLLHTALNLFTADGFHAVGLDRILAEVGVTKTTFYNHFESKDDLIREAIELRDAWETDAFGKQVQERGRFDPKAMLLAMFEVLEEWFTHPDYQGCLFLHATAEFPSPSDPIHRAAARHYTVSEETVRQMAEAAGVDDPVAFAQEWLILLEGALTYRQVTGDDGSAGRARALAERLFAARTA